MSKLCRVVPVIFMFVSTPFKALVDGELRTRDGKNVYSFNFPFTIEFYHKYNFRECWRVYIDWYNSKVRDAKLSLNHASNKLASTYTVARTGYGNFTYSAQMVSDKSAVSSSMSGYVKGRNESEHDYTIFVRLTCYSIGQWNSITSISLEQSSINITVRYCHKSPKSQSPKLRLNYGMRKSFNELSKVHCDDGADLYDGNTKLSSNESTSKCGRFGEWLDNFSCWFVPQVQLNPLPAVFSNKGENAQFSCNVSEGFPYRSSSWLWIGEQNWRNKNNFTMVQMTELHNNKTAFCTASNRAGTSYSSSKVLSVYFPPLLESHIVYLKSGESNYSVKFFSNPPQNSTSLRFLLQVSNSERAAIEGILEEESILRYGTRLQKFTAYMNLPENSTLFFEYDRYGIITSEKLDTIQSCSLVDGYTTIDDTSSAGNYSIALYSAIGAVGLWLFLTVPAIAILVKQRQAQALPPKGETTDPSSRYDNLKPSSETSGNSPYENVYMSSPYEEMGSSSHYETVTA